MIEKWMWFRADDIISSLKKDLLFAHNIEIYNSNVKKIWIKSQCRDLNPRPLPYQGNALPLSYIGSAGRLAWPCWAGDRVRTGDIQLGRLTLYQLSYSRNIKLSIVGRAGFEPAKVKTNRFTVCPRWPLEYLPKMSMIYFSWADGGTRTHDLLITNQLL